MSGRVRVYAALVIVLNATAFFLSCCVQIRCDFDLPSLYAAVMETWALHCKSFYHIFVILITDGNQRTVNMEGH